MNIRQKFIAATIFTMMLFICAAAFAQTIPSGGVQQKSAIVPNNTTGVLVGAGKRVVTSIEVGSISATPAYLKLYDKATAPTCGTDTPVKRLIIPGASAATIGAAVAIPLPAPIHFSLGLGYCVTTGIADADTGAPAASTFLVNIDYN